MSAKKYELKHQDTSFFDSETGLSVTADQQVEIDPKGTGKATMRAIKAGALVEVKTGTASQKKTGAKESKDDKK